jgi:uncharacterized membrane protein YkoI
MDRQCRRVGAFFERTLEGKLKGAFIRRSGARTDNRCMRFLRAPVVVLSGLLWVGLAFPRAWAGDDDHERARAAVQAGEVLPLPTVLERLKRSHPGQVLELELERDDGRWIYEVRLLQADGQLLKLELDARTAEVLEVRRKGERKPRAPSDARR